VLFRSGGDEDRADRAGRVEILALGGVELGVAHPVSDRAFVTERQAGDMFEGAFARDAAAFLADNDDDLAFIVELWAFGRTQDRLFVTDERVRRAAKEARVFLLFGIVLVLGVAVGAVHADADDFLRRTDGRQECDIFQRMVRLTVRYLREFAERAGAEQVEEAGIFRALRQIDDAVPDNGAET